MIHRLDRAAALATIVCPAVALCHGGALAHDSGLENGVFRSRDGGATWLHVTVESFARGALGLAVHPADEHRLLLATDSGLLGSRNGGRDWQAEAPELLSGATFAVAFDVDGQQALASGAQALYRFDGRRWRAARTPSGAAPARALVSGGVAGRVYLAGWTGLHRSDDWGRNWTRVGREIGADPVSALAVSPQHADVMHAVAAGRLWSSSDGARSWQVAAGAPPQVHAVTFDRTRPGRRWLVAAGHVHRSDDGGAHWTSIGTPLPDTQALARAIDATAGALLIATDRGVYRSADGGAAWPLLGSELPTHADAALLVRDPRAPATVYAGFSRIGPERLSGLPAAAEAPLASSRDGALLVGAYAGFAALLLAIGVIVRRATRRPPIAAADRASMRAESSS
jgi:photosystem II stability/assembly factor-like uncharacterized protein